MPSSSAPPLLPVAAVARPFGRTFFEQLKAAGRPYTGGRETTPLVLTTSLAAGTAAAVGWRESAPQLMIGWAMLAYVLWIFIREKRNAAVEKVAAKRKVYALESLDNLIKNEDLRVKEEEAKKEKEEKEKKEKEAKEAKEKADKATEEAAGEPVGEPEPESEPGPEPDPEPEPEPEPEAEGKKDDKEEDNLSKVEKDLKKADEAADERIAPPAEKLFELLYDEIEHACVSCQQAQP